MGLVILLAMLTQLGVAYSMATQSWPREAPAGLQRLAYDTDTDIGWVIESYAILWCSCAIFLHTVSFAALYKPPAWCSQA